ncbi:MAG: IS3 family transposase [Leptospirales bacterium]
MEIGHPRISLERQCELLELNRSSWYYKPCETDPQSEALMRLIDEQYTKRPVYGYRRMTIWLRREGNAVNPKRVQRLMRLMGLEAIYPKPSLSKRNKEHQIYPYLLRNVAIERPNHVFSTDITYIRMQKGFIYLTAIIDWYSRYVLDWEVSVTMESEFCNATLSRVLMRATPEIFNTDQGSQYTSKAFTGLLLEKNIRISMDGRGRALDNVFVERLWRSVKQEEVYLHDYQTVSEAKNGLTAYFRWYNQERPHQSLAYNTPEDVYTGRVTLGQETS